MVVDISELLHVMYYLGSTDTWEAIEETADHSLVTYTSTHINTHTCTHKNIHNHTHTLELQHLDNFRRCNQFCLNCVCVHVRVCAFACMINQITTIQLAILMRTYKQNYNI